jgi:hypothetical protein
MRPKILLGGPQLSGHNHATGLKFDELVSKSQTTVGGLPTREKSFDQVMG